MNKNKAKLRKSVQNLKAWRFEEMFGTPNVSFDESGFWEGENEPAGWLDRDDWQADFEKRRGIKIGDPQQNAAVAIG